MGRCGKQVLELRDMPTVSQIDVEDSEAVGQAVGIAKQMAAEIEYYNDEEGERWVPDPDRPGRSKTVQETPAERWTRMRAWVAKHLKT